MEIIKELIMPLGIILIILTSIIGFAIIGILKLYRLFKENKISKEKWKKSFDKVPDFILEFSFTLLTIAVIILAVILFPITICFLVITFKRYCETEIFKRKIL